MWAGLCGARPRRANGCRARHGQHEGASRTGRRNRVVTPSTPRLQRLSAAIFHAARAFGQRHRTVRRLLRPVAIPLLRRLDPTSAAARLAGYRNWAARYDTPTEADRTAIRADIARMTDPPAISVVMPVYNTPAALLRAAIGSVQAQLYPHWQLCIADDASSAPHVAKMLAEAARADARIVWTRRTRNGHIAAATNTAIGLATGAWVALMDHDDVLPEHALYAVAREILHHPDAAIIYTDEDKIDARGRRSDPYFKPDFDPELLLGQNLISHLGIYRRTLLAEIGGVREGLEGSQDHDLALRAWAACGDAAIRHIPAVLYHWRQDAGGATFSERALERCTAASRRAVTDVLQRRGRDATVEAAPLAPVHHRIRWKLPEPPPLVSVILMRAPDPAPLLGSTAYPHIETLVAGGAVPFGDPRIRVLSQPATPGAWPQRAAAAARGTVLLFLDGWLCPLTPDWLHELVAQALRPEIGAVGGKLLGPTGRVSEAGLVLGLDTGATPFLSGAARRDPGPAGALALARSVAAVSAACLATRREVLATAGGLDPTAPDPDTAAIRYCLRVRNRGLRVVCTPFAELYWPHGARAFPHGSVEPAGTEDPYYNSNYARANGDARLAWPPARPAWRTAGSG